jgi:hypothetical protein
MAQVTDTLTLRQRIDADLDYLFLEWRSVPQLTEEWAEWEDHDRYDFWLEWPIREGYLRELREWSEQGLLTPAQRERYEELLGLIARHRPVLEGLFAGE